MDFPTRLKEKRIQNGYSQENVAIYLNISRQTISKWENGTCYPCLDNLILLSTYYGVTIDELLKGKT